MPLRRLIILLVLAAPLAVLTAVALAAPDRTATMSAEKPKYEWTGIDGPGVNPDYDAGSGEICDSSDPTALCDQTLINVDVADPVGVKLAVDVAVGTDDLDVYIYESDATGKTGALKDSDGQPPGTDEHVDVMNAKGYYLVKVVFFAAPVGGYSGTATLTGAVAAMPTPAATPEPTPTPTPTPEPTPAPTAAPPPPAATPAPPQPLAVTMSAVRERRRTVLRRRPGVRLGCRETCLARLSARIDARTARRLRLGRRATTIGTAAVTVMPGSTRAYRLDWTPRARAALRRARRFKVTFIAVVTDADGRRGRRLTRRAAYR